MGDLPYPVYLKVILHHGRPTLPSLFEGHTSPWETYPTQSMLRSYFTMGDLPYPAYLEVILHHGRPTLPSLFEGHTSP